MSAPAEIGFSPVLAGAPGECCFTGVKHTGDPIGKSITIADVPTYISEPPSGANGIEKIILFLADVYGPFYLNNQLLQDYFASQGFLVLGIDYFFGDPVYIHSEEPDFDRPGWMAKSRAKAAEVTFKWVEEVIKIYGTNVKYSAVGYCFGGPFALELATTDIIVASALAHPAFLNEDHFKKITKPLLLSCAEIDHTFPTESRRRAVDILAEKKASYHVEVFSGVAHGFAVRASLEDENSRWAKEESARSVIKWFKRFSVL